MWCICLQVAGQVRFTSSSVTCTCLHYARVNRPLHMHAIRYIWMFGQYAYSFCFWLKSSKVQDSIYWYSNLFGSQYRPILMCMLVFSPPHGSKAPSSFYCRSGLPCEGGGKWKPECIFVWVGSGCIAGAFLWFDEPMCLMCCIVFGSALAKTPSVGELGPSQMPHRIK